MQTAALASFYSFPGTQTFNNCQQRCQRVLHVKWRELSSMAF